MNLKLTHREYGGENDAPPLVVLHGLFGSARNWHSMAARLAAARRVYALDLRNHGNAPWADDMSYQAMAADVQQFAADRGLEQIDLLGHSMGGKVAMVLALTAPRLVARLVIVDVAPVRYSHSFSSYLEAMQALDMPSIKHRSEADALLRQAIPNDRVRGFLLHNLARDDAGRLTWRINLRAIANDMEKIVGFPAIGDGASYAGTVCFIRGQDSDYLLPAHHESIQRLLPEASYVTIAGAGHWVHAEQPERFFQAALNSLR